MYGSVRVGKCETFGWENIQPGFLASQLPNDILCREGEGR